MDGCSLIPKKERDPYYGEDFAKCYLAYSSAMLSFLDRYVGDRNISEELMQDVYLKLYERGVRLDYTVPTTKSFLLTVAKNTALDYLRRKSLEERQYRRKVLEEVTVDAAFFRGLEESVCEGEVLSTLYDVIGSLPEDERDIFVERSIQGKTCTDIMRERNVTRFHVNRIVRTAEHEIKKRLGGFFK